MIGFRTINLTILILFIVVILISLLNIVSISPIDIAAYTLIFFGISFYYSSYIKHYKTGVFTGSVMFLSGTILFVFSKFEIWNFGTVFVPSALIIIGFSLLLSTILTKTNSASILFSVLCLIAGVWLVILRGTATADLYFSAVYSLFKSYWVIILFFTGIIILTARNIKK